MYYIILMSVFLTSCAHKHIDKEQYKYANPSAKRECLKYDDGRECTQYMKWGPVR